MFHFRSPTIFPMLVSLPSTNCSIRLPLSTFKLDDFLFLDCGCCCSCLAGAVLFLTLMYATPFHGRSSPTTLDLSIGSQRLLGSAKLPSLLFPSHDIWRSSSAIGSSAEVAGCLLSNSFSP